MKQIYYLSISQNQAEIDDELCYPREIWVKAQILVERNTYSLGNLLYGFPNKRFFIQKHTEISKAVVDLHFYANRYAKTLSDYKNRKCLWVYNHSNKVIFH